MIYRIYTRFSLAFLMALVVVVALGLAAMRYPSPLTLRVVFTLMLGSLLLGTLAALVRRANGGWAGLALFGWSYALLYLPSVSSAINPKFLITSPLVQIADRMHKEPVDRKQELEPKVPVSPAVGMMLEDGIFYTWDGQGYHPETSSERVVREKAEAPERAREIARILQGFLFTLLGSLLGRIFAGSGDGGPRGRSAHPTKQ